MPDQANPLQEAERVLDVWFGTLDESGRADAAHAQRWWSKEDAFDASLRAQFSSLHAAVMAGEHEHWLLDPRGALAYVVLLDQFSRNMFRGTPQSFASDEKALSAAVRSIDAGQDRKLRVDERLFLYMPFMHSEELAMQERCIALMTALRDEQPKTARDELAQNLDFAEHHRVIIARFGRFPHRNAILGRSSTPEELEFLTQPGSSF